MYRRITCAIVLCCIGAPTSFAEVNWPSFRGSSGGVVEDQVLPVAWSTTENVVWKVDIVGRAWSCPVVWGDKVFLTTVASEGHVEEAKKGLYFGGDRNKPSTALHHWTVYCFNWDSGETLWQKTVHKGKPAQPVHIKNTYASETPVSSGAGIDRSGPFWRSRRKPCSRFGFYGQIDPNLHLQSSPTTMKCPG